MTWFKYTYKKTEWKTGRREFTTPAKEKGEEWGGAGTEGHLAGNRRNSRCVWINAVSSILT